MGFRHSFKVRLAQAVAVLVAAGAFAGTAQAQTQTIATPLNVDAITLLSPFTTLLNTTALTQNFSTAIAVNNNATTAQRNQSIIDNTITTDNGVVLSDALGSRMSTIWNSVNSQTSSGSTTTFSQNLLQLFRQINAISQDDSGKAKNFFADGSANGSVFISNNNLAGGKTPTSNTPVPPATVSLPAGGVFSIYDQAYAPVTSPNLTGNSRPFQVDPNAITVFSAPNYFGTVQSNTQIAGGVNGNVGTGLFANASAPSGHTTFGYTTSLLFAMLVPERFQEFMTRASEYGNSRIVLGVHYPLDVEMGRILATYDVVQMLNNNPKYLNFTVNGVFGIGDVTTTSNFQTLFDAASTDVRNLLQTGCGTTISACAATSAPDRFSNYEQNKADYTARLTYGLAPVGPTDLAPVVPVGAEVLIATRFPYLSAAQQRDVLATTELPSGGPLDNADPQYAGYSRLNLFAAGDGFGAFNGPVSVTMNAASGGFNAFDAWNNNITDGSVQTGAGGPVVGSLTKDGTGMLVLTGNNSYTGGTNVNGGALILSSVQPGITATVLGQTNVAAGAAFGGIGQAGSTNVGGVLVAGTPLFPGGLASIFETGQAAQGGTLSIQGDLQLTAGSQYMMLFTPGASSRTDVSGTATIAGTSTAIVSFAPGIYTVGGKIPVLTTSANGLTGTFLSLTANSVGINVTPHLSYDGQDAYISLSQALFPALPGASTNANSVLSALNGFINAGGTLPTTFQPIFGLTQPNMANTLQQMASQTGTAWTPGVTSSMNLFFNTIFDQGGAGSSAPVGGSAGAMSFAAEDTPVAGEELAYAPESAAHAMIRKAVPGPAAPLAPTWKAWAASFGGASSLDGDPSTGNQGISTHIWSILGGAEYRVNPSLTLGAAISGGETTFALDAGGGSGHSDFVQGSVYGKYWIGNAYAAAGVAGGSHDVKTNRVVQLGPTFDTITASFTAPTFAGRFETGYRYGVGPAVLTPYAAVQVQSISTPNYSETGTLGLGTAALSFAGQDTTQTRTDVGAWIEQRMANNVLVRARAAWVHDFDTESSISATFESVPTVGFVTVGAPRPANSALVSGVAEMPIATNVTLSARFDGEFASSASTITGMGIVRYVW